MSDVTDIWLLALDGSGGTRLTDGSRAELQHRLVSMVPCNATSAERAVDLTTPVYVSLFGRRTKQSGYARLTGGRVERYVFTRQRFDYYPANFDPPMKYPMVVYTSELLSQGLHRYNVPRENDYYNTNAFLQNGYVVLMPDIVFRPREPGIGTLQAVEPAVRAVLAVLARGLVDPARVGHMGHSQGGYEGAFLVTHSRLFATAVMGAGISDKVSFAGQMPCANVPEFDHWETGQFRMQVPPWDDPEAMRRNSPLERIHKTPATACSSRSGVRTPPSTCGRVCSATTMRGAPARAW